jgi:hypothetical protein
MLVLFELGIISRLGLLVAGLVVLEGMMKHWDNSPPWNLQ